MRFPLFGKVLGLGAVLVALLCGLNLVSGIVAERQGRLQEAQRSVAASLAGGQSVVGPVLQRTCSETWTSVQGTGNDRKTVAERRDFVLTSSPRHLAIDAQTAMEPRRRGIYRINGYVVSATLKAQWTDLAALQPAREHEGSMLQCAAPLLWVAVGDPRGIRAVQVQAQGTELAVEAGTPRSSQPRGFHASLQPLWPQGEMRSEPLQLQMMLELAGTEDLDFAPIGDTTQVKLTSNWP